MITIHHLNQSRSFRVVWLMEELGLPYDLVCHARQPDLRAPDTLRAAHPLGIAPVITDDKTVIFESGAILEYIIHRYGQGRLAVPCHHIDYPLYLQWLHAAEATAMPAVLPLVKVALGMGAADPGQQDANDRMLAWASEALAQNPFFGGTVFSAADIMMHYYLAITAHFLPESMSRHPRLGDFLDRMRQRPAFAHTIEVAGTVELRV